MIPFSILDLAHINQGQTPRDAFHRSLDLAQHAEDWGYNRYWVAEHHNMPNIASAATSVLIGYLAAGTKTIRVGAGGIMLPNHTPLVIAEQFGTLESLYPNRIDLGLGRAPGTDHHTAHALRRDPMRADHFAEEVVELESYFSPQEGQSINATPGKDLNIPLWILGSSLYGAQLAAALGLPYAFAAHFAPDYLMQAFDVYQAQFKPSKYLDKPYAMLCMNAVAAETDDEAKHLFTTMQQSFTQLVRGDRKLASPPIKSMADYWSPTEERQVSRMLKYSVVGSSATVKTEMARILAETKADEIMIAASIFDGGARLRSFELMANIMSSL